MLRFLIFFSLILLSPLARAAGADPDADRAMTATRVTTPPVIDGKLDDDAWAHATVQDRFFEFQPREHANPSQRTEMRIVYDDDAVYVGLHMFDDDPSKIVARLTRRDRDIESDWVGVLFDSRNDRASAYGFRVNAAGVQLDGLWFDDTNMSIDWDAVWSSAVVRDATGWSAEMRVPLSVLRFSSRDVQSWGFQCYRYISRAKEMDMWSFISTTDPGMVSRFGHLEGLTGLRPRRTFELRPYAAARLTADSGSGGAAFAFDDPSGVTGGFDGGADLKLGVTSDLTLDATVNPDFGQVEADQVVLNLSRFETFFPEKRPFFLEGVDLFNTPISMFYSRRLGRPPSGLGDGDGITTKDGRDLTVVSAPRSLRIWSAAKLTGKITKRLQVGAIEAVTGAEDVTAVDASGGQEKVRLAPLRSYALLRTRYDFGSASYLGAIATAVDRMGGELRRASANHDAYGAGLDGEWVIDPAHARVTAQLAVTERVGGTGYRHTGDGSSCLGPGGDCVPITRTDGTRMGPGATGLGANVSFVGMGRHFLSRAWYSAYTPKFDPNDMGFLTNFDQHEFKAFAGYNQTQPGKWFRSHDEIAGGIVTTAWDGTPRQVINFVNLEPTLSNYLYANIEGDAFWGGVYDINETFDGSRFQQPSSFGGSIHVASDSRKKVFVNWTGVNAFFATDGSRDLSAQATVNFQLLPQLELSIAPEGGLSRAVRFYSCTQPNGASCTIDTNDRHYMFAQQDTGYVSLTVRGTWTFSPWISVQAYAQLFSDKGAFSKYRTIDTTSARPIIRRGALMPSTFTGDNDGDGVKDDDFQDTALNVNVVMRWEFQPGSTLIGVFTRAESGAFDLMGRAPKFRFSGLTSGPTEDVLLVKWVYFLD